MTHKLEEVARLLECDTEKGLLKWKIRRSNRCASGWFKGTPDTAGYLKVMINLKPVAVHRLVWLFHTGEWPTLTIDHDDGDIQNNCISNLKLATTQDQNKNQSVRRTNKLGVLGVRKTKTGKYQARIVVDGVRIHLGNYSTLEEAAISRKQAEKKYNFHPNHGRRKP